MTKSEGKPLNYKLWAVLILTGFIPLVYSTTRIHFLGAVPDPWTFSIAAQVAWLNVGYEVLSEALLIPLAFMLGKVIKDEQALAQRVSTSLRIILSSYAVVTALVLYFTPQLVGAMNQQTNLFHSTVQYIRLESFAIMLSSLYAFLLLILVLKDNQTMLYRLLLVQTVMTILCDSVLVSRHGFSFQLGVVGIAVSNIIVNGLLAVIATVYLAKTGVKLSMRQGKGTQQRWLKEWGTIGWKSGVESLVRNTAFIVMILQLINQVQEAGTFWLANQFIWGWLLLPVLTLGQLIKQDAATNNGLTSERVDRYLWLSGGIVSLWLLSAPLWSHFIANVMGISDAQAVTELVWLMAGFYAVFSLNNVIDSYFYGIGRTDLMLYQSLLVNSVFYGGAFMLYQLGIFVPTLQGIALMFGLGMTVDAMVTWGLYRALRNKQNIAQPLAQAAT